MITLDDIIDFIHHPLAYDQKLVWMIHGDEALIVPLAHCGQLYTCGNASIKVEGLERYSKDVWDLCMKYANQHNHYGPVTCHGFIAKQDSPSFGLHKDPEDVIIYCVSGTKTLVIGDRTVTLSSGEDVFIPAYTPHRASNEHAAFTLSFGLERFLKDKQYNELDDISQDNRNMQSELSPLLY